MRQSSSEGRQISLAQLHRLLDAHGPARGASLRGFPSMQQQLLSFDWSKVATAELHMCDLTEDDGRDFDFGGYSRNVSSRQCHESKVASLLGQLQRHVDSWHFVFFEVKCFIGYNTNSLHNKLLARCSKKLKCMAKTCSAQVQS